MEASVIALEHHDRSEIDQRRLAIEFPEILEVERQAHKLEKYGRVRKENSIQLGELSLPIYSFEFGNPDKSAPVAAFIGGVHGLERIGSQVIMEYMKTFRELLSWDSLIQRLLETCRVVFYPIANPTGFFNKTRSNYRGVDLMRNAPIDAPELGPFNLVGGHRISPRLPWYRGRKDHDMEVETQTLHNFMQRQIRHSPFAISVDFHSGFGHLDRLWFPYAHSRNPFPNLTQMFALKRKIDQALPNHVYKIEPQTACYMTHGDLWDFLHLSYLRANPLGIYLPLTLEMGSWIWIRKNPRQLFNLLGIFNPMIPHRTRRILRRHTPLIDLILRATSSYERWVNPEGKKLSFYQEEAQALWYRNQG